MCPHACIQESTNSACCGPRRGPCECAVHLVLGTSAPHGLQQIPRDSMPPVTGRKGRSAGSCPSVMAGNACFTPFQAPLANTRSQLYTCYPVSPCIPDLICAFTRSLISLHLSFRVRCIQSQVAPYVICLLVGLACLLCHRLVC